MELESAKVGEADQDGFVALDNFGKQRMPHEAIAPILCKSDDGKWQLVGTGFFLTGNGLLATAKHVLDELFEENGSPRCHTEIIQFQPDGIEYIRRKLVRCSIHRCADIAVSVAEPLKSLSSGGLLVNACVTLSTRTLGIGEKVFTFAYPNTVHVPGYPQGIHLNPRYYAGDISEYFPDGRDRVLLPGPCYQTSITLHGGASGGPVFDLHGNVIGINSTGYEGCPDVSFISRIEELLDLDIREDDSAAAKRIQLRDVASRGFIRLE